MQDWKQLRRAYQITNTWPCSIRPKFVGLLPLKVCSASPHQYYTTPSTPKLCNSGKCLTQAFAFLGKSFCRRSPTPLQLDMYRYTDCIEKICLQFKSLSAKLRLAGKVLDLLQQNKNVSRDYYERTLFDPEAVWTTLLLQQRHRLSQQNYKLSLNHSWRGGLTSLLKVG